MGKGGGLEIAGNWLDRAIEVKERLNAASRQESPRREGRGTSTRRRILRVREEKGRNSGDWMIGDVGEQ